MNNQEPKKTNNLGYKLGQALTILLSTCIAAIVVALTIRLVLWILWVM